MPPPQSRSHPGHLCRRYRTRETLQRASRSPSSPMSVQVLVTMRSYPNFMGCPWQPLLRASAPPIFIPRAGASTPGGPFPVGLLGDPARGPRLHRLNWWEVQRQQRV